MNKVIFCLVVLFNSSVIFSCTFPYEGPKYDSLIEITKLNENGQFYIELPKEVASSIKPEVFIIRYTKDRYKNTIYLSKLFETGKFISSDEYDNILDASQPEKHTKIKSLKSKNGKIFKKLYIDLNENYIHIISVHWPPETCCLCSAYGISEPLENIKLKTQE